MRSIRRKEAIDLAREKAEKAGAENIELFCGEAIDILPTLDRIDCAFIGGSGNLDRVLRILHTFHTRSIVVNAVKIDTLNLAINTMEQLGFLKRHCTSRSENLIPLPVASCSNLSIPCILLSGDARRARRTRAWSRRPGTPDPQGSEAAEGSR